MGCFPICAAPLLEAALSGPICPPSAALNQGHSQTRCHGPPRDHQTYIKIHSVSLVNHSFVQEYLDVQYCNEKIIPWKKESHWFFQQREGEKETEQ